MDEEKPAGDGQRVTGKRARSRGLWCGPSSPIGGRPWRVDFPDRGCPEVDWNVPLQVLGREAQKKGSNGSLNIAGLKQSLFTKQ